MQLKEITKEAAYKLARKLLKKIESGDRYLIDEKRTEDHDWGWIIHYNSEAYLKTGNTSMALFGNAPFHIEKSGKVIATSSSEPGAGPIDQPLSDKGHD
jgi:hypothetical protein